MRPTLFSTGSSAISIEDTRILQRKGNGNIVTSSPLTRRSGDHRLEGIFIAYGRGVAPGSRIENANIMDIAPMILEFLNVKVPEDLGGKSLPDVFR